MQILTPHAYTHGTYIGDPRLEKAGSLLLVEPARDSKTGVTSSLTNYAAASFKSLTGNDVNSVSVLNTLSVLSGAEMQRTAGGGLKLIFPASPAAMESRASFSLILPTEVKNYIQANLTHKFYLVICGKIRRDAAVSSTSITMAGINANADAANDNEQKTLAIYQNASSKTITGSRTDDKLINRRNAVSGGIFVAGAAKNGLELTGAFTPNSIRNEIVTMGAPSTAIFTGIPEWDFYSIHLKDLTVSGETWEEADAVAQLVLEQRIGSGGPYSVDFM